MYQLKKALATAGASTILVLGLTGAASASPYHHHDSYTNNSYNKSYNKTITVTNTDDHSINVNGNCSGVIQNNVEQSQSSSQNSSGGNQGNLGGNLGGDNTNSQSNSQSNSNSSSQSQSNNVTFAPNCSTTTNTTVKLVKATTVAAKPAVVSEQVVAPTGGVHAGGGAGVANASSAGSIAGLAVSAGSLGAGAFLRRKSLLGLLGQSA